MVRAGVPIVFGVLTVLAIEQVRRCAVLAECCTH